MLRAVVNGAIVDDVDRAIAVEDRGLAYGDGLFETMRLRAGAIRFLDDHLARLSLGCERLGIHAPSEQVWRSDLSAVVADESQGVVKYLVTRGASGRGYLAAEQTAPTRIAMLYAPMAHSDRDGIAVRWCTMRLSRNAKLAGIKHLNRLEYVLARNEWREASIADGLLLDTEGELVEAVTSNVFAVVDGVLTTPDLRFCGVHGIYRRQVLVAAVRLGLDINEEAMHVENLLNASEVFLTNAIRGIRPVCALEDRRWPIGPVTRRLAQSLEGAE